VKGWNVICAGVVVAAVVMLGLLLSMRPAATPRAGATTDQRVLQGPYIASTKALSDTEDLRIVVIPHPLGEFFDTTCVIYTHRTFNTATFVCPDADKMNLRDSIRDNELQRPLR